VVKENSMETSIEDVEDWEPGVAVLLDWFEIEQAALVGVRRRVESLRQQKQDAHGFDASAKWENDIQAAGAEIAFAKATGQYWDFSCNTWKRGDVGTWQVRWTPLDSGALIVRPVDADDDVFVLVIGRLPEFRIVGCIPGRRAKQERWLNAPNERPPAYFVPQAWLRPVDTSPRT
jgi:hypothetical protein